MTKAIFEETQSNTIVIVVSIVVSLFIGGLCLAQIISHTPIGNHPAPTWLLLVFFIGSIIGAIFFSRQKLKLLITEDEIHISFGLLTGEIILRIGDIKSISIRKYDALKEFWGWGVKYSSDTNCFTVSGSDGIQINMKDNRKFLVGTQNVIAAKPVIDYLQSRIEAV
jgi:hypothetical protein